MQSLQLMNSAKLFWYWLRRKLNLGPLLLVLHPKSFLVVEGWNRSFRENRSVNRNGEPIPWCAYSFIHFIELRLTKQMRVFEYGCGGSTLFYAQRVGEIISVEHDSHWAHQVNARLPNNGQVVIRQDAQKYLGEISHHGKFDLIIIDGILRAQTVEFVLQAMNEDSVIIWDDPELPDFAAGFEVLRKHGFRELTFYGEGPITFVPSYTAILYRDKNCLGI